MRNLASRIVEALLLDEHSNEVPEAMARAAMDAVDVDL